jgi:delta 1-pyrroline-5-carboxylate dehydrogenase
MAKEILIKESDLIRMITKMVNEVKQEQEMKEGIFGPDKKDLELRKIDLIRKIDDLMEEMGLTDGDLHNSIDSVIRQAEENNYDGEVDIRQSRTGRIVLLFKPTPSKLHRSGFYKNFAEPLAGGLKKFR